MHTYHWKYKAPQHNKYYIEVSGPPSDHYRRQNESPTCRCHRSPTGADLTLSLTIRISSCSVPMVHCPRADVVVVEPLNHLK